jgi:hypothetical protein
LILGKAARRADAAPFVIIINTLVDRRAFVSERNRDFCEKRGAGDVEKSG